jgi:hypothetical protein
MHRLHPWGSWKGNHPWQPSGEDAWGTAAVAAGIEPCCGPETREKAGVAMAATSGPAGSRTREFAGA